MPQIAADRIRGIKGAAAYFGGFTRLFPGALCQLYGLVSTHIGILLIESGRMPDAPNLAVHGINLVCDFAEILIWRLQ